MAYTRIRVLEARKWDCSCRSLDEVVGSEAGVKHVRMSYAYE